METLDIALISQWAKGVTTTFLSRLGEWQTRATPNSDSFIPPTLKTRQNWCFESSSYDAGFAETPPRFNWSECQWAVTPVIFFFLAIPGIERRCVLLLRYAPGPILSYFISRPGLTKLRRNSLSRERERHTHTESVRVRVGVRVRVRMRAHARPEASREPGSSGVRLPKYWGYKRAPPRPATCNTFRSFHVFHRTTLLTKKTIHETIGSVLSVVIHCRK